MRAVLARIVLALWCAYKEWHVLLINGTYSSGKEFHVEREFQVVNLTKVTT